MKRLLASGAAVAAMLALAACGGSDNGGSSTTTAKPASGATVSVRQIDGVGSVLVDSSGKALYASEQEADGKIRCTGGCTSFWQPLVAGTATPKAAADAGKLGVVRRPDGKRQVTVDGKPVYTFAEDAPGKVTGNGFKDSFDGQRFVWHAMLAGGKPSQGSGSGSSGKSGGGGYSY